MAVQLQDFCWTTHDSILIDFDYRNVGLASAVQKLFEKNVITSVHLDGKRIRPKTIGWWNEVFELRLIDRVGQHPLFERRNLLEHSRSCSSRELEEHLAHRCIRRHCRRTIGVLGEYDDSVVTSVI